MLCLIFGLLVRKNNEFQLNLEIVMTFIDKTINQLISNKIGRLIDNENYT